MAAAWLRPGDERLLWELLVREPGFNLPALHLFEQHGLAGSARFAVQHDPSGLPVCGAAGLGDRWYLFGDPFASTPPPSAPELAPLLAAAGVALLEGEENLSRTLLRHPALGTLLPALESHVVAVAGPPPPRPEPSPAAPPSASAPPEPSHLRPAGPGTPGVRVRPATVADVPAVERLYRGHGEAADRATLVDAASAASLWVAASADGALLGAAMAPVRTALAAWVGAVFTHPEHRGRGIASALVAALTRSLQTWGLAVYLLYRPGGPARLYHRLGFTPVGAWLQAQRLPGREIQAVGGLVQHQEVRPGQQDLGQGEADLLAAREVRHPLQDRIAPQKRQPRRVRTSI
ncbi:hypothetical protein LIP_1874 [Limnochorda pilosa]|uniref:N-acetyltransferase domain-containing protein n=1 Tax=Limnochorda pilosa TaxID=1555112 RepID=A0A0K2SL45_LIMPI|nr:hypothetical protein LIP_1874 [Limnochorda pilosa]